MLTWKGRDRSRDHLMACSASGGAWRAQGHGQLRVRPRRRSRTRSKRARIGTETADRRGTLGRHGLEATPIARPDSSLTCRASSLHRFDHSSPQFLERDVPYIGLEPDEICARRERRGRLPGDRTQAPPVAVAIDRLTDLSGYGVGHSVGLIGRQRGLVLYCDGTRAGTSPRSSKGLERCSPFQRLDPTLHIVSELCNHVPPWTAPAVTLEGAVGENVEGSG